MIEAIITIISGIVGTIAAVYSIKSIRDSSKKKNAKEPAVVETKKPVTPNKSEVLPERETNLTSIDNAFLGREEDIKELKKLILDDDKRVVTILGMGGLGKTRLAKELGFNLRNNYVGGVWFVDLIETTSEAGISKAIFDTFGEDMASSQIDARDAVVELLNDKPKMLIILDNFERIVEFSDESVSYWVEKLPKIDFLVTSRIALRLQVEQQYRLDPLKILPTKGSDFKSIKSNSSVQLFIERAKQKNRNFIIDEQNAPYVNEICNQLEGIPLAIELAAGGISLLTPKEIAKSLDNKLRFKDGIQDRDEKHKTLESAIEWSFQLLSEAEKDVFLQMSIFRDGFTLNAAKNVIKFKADEHFTSINEVVNSLVEKSLVRIFYRNNTNRFDMFVPIEDFAKENLQKLKNKIFIENLVERWSKYYLNFIETQNKELRTKEGSSALENIGEELENVFAIQETNIGLNNPIDSAKIILAFAKTMAVKGPALLRVPRLKLSFDAFKNLDHELIGCLAFELSKAHLDKGEWNEAEMYAEKAVNIAEKNNEKNNLAVALMQQGKMFKERGYLKRSIKVLDKAIVLFRELNTTSNVAICLTYKAATQERLGDFSDALQSFQEAENISEENSDLLQKGMIYNRRGLAYWHHGEVEEALKSIKISQEISKIAGNEMWVPAHKTNEGLYLADLDRFDEAIEKFKEADILHKEKGTIHWAAVNNGGWGRALLMRNTKNDLNQAVELLNKAEEVSRKIYYPENIALHTGDLGRLYFIRENWMESYNLISEAVALERRMGASREHRHFCNLVVLASTCNKLNKKTQEWESLVRATQLKNDLNLDSTHQIRKVREDVERLNIHLNNWNENNKLNKEINYSGIFKNSLLQPPKLISKLEFSESRVFTLLDRVQKMLDITGYEYPWYSLEEELKETKKTKILLFGYGSLLNKVSAKKTINEDSVNNYRPVIGFGIRRLLDYNMPDAVKSRSMYKDVPDPNAIGLFNARFTGSITDSANGALIEVKIEDIESLRQREIGYDLRPLICIPWNNPNGEIIEAYTLGCSGRMWEGKMLSDSSILPHEGYLNLCRVGAEKIGNEFLDYFLETSFLADGKTKIKDWIKKQ